MPQNSFTVTHFSCQVAGLVSCHNPGWVRSALLMRLGGLPSDGAVRDPSDLHGVGLRRELGGSPIPRRRSVRTACTTRLIPSADDPATGRDTLGLEKGLQVRILEMR